MRLEISPWGYGGMVDAEDLKSFGHCDRVGSSPTIPTTNFHPGCVAQLVRALRSHRRGRWFESNHIHHSSLLAQSRDRVYFSDEEPTGVGLTTSESQTKVWRSAKPMSTVRSNF